MTDDDPLIPDDWLQRRLIVDQAEAENLYDGILFGSMNQEWLGLALKSQKIDGDEVWEFSSSSDSWGHLAGRAGVAIVRDEKAIVCMVTVMN
jgi:hypothetical protein